MRLAVLPLDSATIARFWERVERRPANECWPWVGRAIAGKGNRGVFDVRQRAIYAPRVAWVIAKAEDPGDLLVCHSCDNPNCVNPAHLWLGTELDNMRDMIAKGRHSETRKTHCVHGHEFNHENTLVMNGQRKCRPCKRNADARRRAKKAGLVKP